MLVSNRKIVGSVPLKTYGINYKQSIELLVFTITDLIMKVKAKLTIVTRYVYYLSKILSRYVYLEVWQENLSN